MYKDKGLIITKCGDLDGDSQCEKITLIGTQYEKNYPYMKSLQLVIEKNDNTQNIFNIEVEGYAFNLFLVNILEGSTDQILITGQCGGTGGYATTRLYQYKNNKLKLILDDESLAKQLNCSAKYLKGYKVEVNCKYTNKKYIIDISKNFKGYLDLAYDKEANVFENEIPTVSYPNTIYSIIAEYNNYYSLQIQQRIVGVSNGDLLGAIQSVVEIDDNGKISIKEQYLLLFDREIR